MSSNNKVGHRHHVLKVGSRGAPVKRLEKALKAEGLLKGKADGFYDAKTKAAVRKWEDKHGWSEKGRKEDGIVGKTIWKQLNLSGAAHHGSVAEVSAGTPTQNGQPVTGGGQAQGGAQAQGGGQAQAQQAANAGNGRTDNFKTVTVNVQALPLMSQQKVVHDVRRAAASGDIVGFNEISKPRYAQAIKNLGPAWGKYMPKGNPNPIIWKKSKFDLVDAGVKQTHKGLKKVSPNRSVTWVKLRDKKTGKVFVRMNTHLVSGAFSGKSHHAYRIQSWHKHIAVMQRMIKSFERQGFPVIVGGDFNRDSNKVLGNTVKYDNKLNVGTHGRSTYDYLMHTGAGLKSTGVRVDKNYASDHNAVTASYSLKG